MTAQATQVFENLKVALAAVGATFNDVIKLNTYVTSMARSQDFREVRDRYVNPRRRPPAPPSKYVDCSATSSSSRWRRSSRCRRSHRDVAGAEAPMLILVCVAFLIGMMLPLQAGINAQLRGGLGHPLLPAIASFAVGTLGLAACRLSSRAYACRPRLSPRFHGGTGPAACLAPSTSLPR